MIGHHDVPHYKYLYSIYLQLMLLNIKYDHAVGRNISPFAMFAKALCAGKALTLGLQ